VEIFGSARSTGAVALAGLTAAWSAAAIPVWLGAAAWQDPRPLPILGFALALAGSGIVFGLYGAALRHFRAPILLTPLLPVGAALAAVLGAHSARLRRRGRVRWKGRTYRVDPLLKPSR
jgi:hypothetical protein